jgi:hypothetical protein
VPRTARSAADPRLAIAMDEAVRAIDGQREAVDSLRARVGILLSAATLATSFLGGIALEGRSLLFFGYVAIALFILHIAIGLGLLWPTGFGFQTSAQLMVKQWIDADDVSEGRMRRRFIYWADTHSKENAKRLDGLWEWYRTAIGVLGLEITAWIMEVGGFEGWLRGLLFR